MKRRLIIMTLLLVILATSVITISASNSGIMPRFNNTGAVSTNFTISSTGKATISATYDAYSSLFTEARITSYIEKRTLGLFGLKLISANLITSGLTLLPIILMLLVMLFNSKIKALTALPSSMKSAAQVVQLMSSNMRKNVPTRD